MSDLGRWEPFTPYETASVFDRSGIARPWWIAGGYAIELFVGRPVRAHDDIDVAILRRDQQVLHKVLPGWDIQVADPPGHVRTWMRGEVLPPPVHDIWCRENTSAPWRVQFMLECADGEQWFSRRDASIRRPLSQLGRITPGGCPFLSPEIQLYYKATSDRQRPKDDIDFRAALPHLDDLARRWLDQALTRTHPDHPWRTALAT